MIDAINCRTIAQSLAPFRTGNLRFNSITHQVNVDGFSIIAVYQTAPYIHYLNTGTQNTQKHVGWWSVKVALETTRYMQMKLSGDELRANAMMYEAQELLDQTREQNLVNRFKTLMKSEDITNQFKLGGIV